MPDNLNQETLQVKLKHHSDGKKVTSRSEHQTEELSLLPQTEEFTSDQEPEEVINNSSSMPEPRLLLLEDTETYLSLPNQLEETDSNFWQEEPKEPLQSFSPDQEAEESSKWLPTKTTYGEPADQALSL